MLERDAMAQAQGRGPRFSLQGGQTMFSFVIDPTNVVGPRPVREDDKAKYPGEWAEFTASDDYHNVVIADGPAPAPAEAAQEPPAAGEGPEVAAAPPEPATEHPGGAAEGSAVDQETVGPDQGEDLSSMTRQALMKELAAIGASFAISDNRDELAAKLAAARNGDA